MDAVCCELRQAVHRQEGGEEAQVCAAVCLQPGQAGAHVVGDALVPRERDIHLCSVWSVGAWVGGHVVLAVCAECLRERCMGRG